MCDNTNNNVNPMPEGGGRKATVTLKSMIGVTALFDFGFSIASGALKKIDEEGHKKAINVLDGLNLIPTLVDFGLSCAAGYGFYAPMDASNKRISGSDYENIIKDTSNAAAKYSTIWIVKTVIALFIPAASLITSLCGDKEKPKSDFFKNVEKLNSACSGIMCFISTIFEVIACVEAAKVNSNGLNDNQKTDRTCFIWETSGFICSDICSMIDAIMSIGDIKNIGILIAREVFALAYSCSMFAEAGYINGTW